MREITANPELISFCGLYCGACGAYRRDKCPGCQANVKATWCGIRACCLEHSYSSCADCGDFAEVNDCGKFNNLISRVISFIFRSNRRACIENIRARGPRAHAELMAEMRRHSMKR
jgi:hypothetical protein